MPGNECSLVSRVCASLICPAANPPSHLLPQHMGPICIEMPCTITAGLYLLPQPGQVQAAYVDTIQQHCA